VLTVAGVWKRLTSSNCGRIRTEQCRRQLRRVGRGGCTGQADECEGNERGYNVGAIAGALIPILSNERGTKVSFLLVSFL
jgi:hypothetical protein